MLENSYIKRQEEWYGRPLKQHEATSIPELLDLSANRWPDNIALRCMDGRWSYRDLRKRLAQIASALASFGVKKGDRVAIFMPNNLEYMPIFLGITAAGATIVPLNAMLKAPELEKLLLDSGARVLFLDARLYPAAQPLIAKKVLDHVILLDPAHTGVRPEGDSGVLDYEEMLAGASGEMQIPRNALGEPALLLYTAGTTGAPKGVLLTHGNLVVTSSHVVAAYDMSEEDSVLLLFPFSHSAAYLPFTFPLFSVGGTVILYPRFEPTTFLQMLDRYKVTMFGGPPTVYIAFLSHPQFSSFDLSSLRLTIAGAAPVPDTLQRKWKETVGTDLINGYGLTETTASALASFPHKINLEPGCMGVPIGGEVRIADESGSTLPIEKVGEIQFRGPQVMKGYWNRPDLTEAAFTGDNWFKTGDAGYMNEEGFVYFVERFKDLIIASGYNIAPAEVEQVILQHPAVLEAAVIGVPDPYRGETVEAYVVLRDEYKGKVAPEEIVEFCRARMAAYKYPRIVEFIDALPKSSVHKVLRRVLREMHTASSQQGNGQK